MQLSSNLIQPLATVSKNTASNSFAEDLTPFPVEVQWMSNWCWAASTVSLCNFYGKPGPFTQQQFVASILNTPICAAGPPNPYCNQEYDFGDALEYVKHLDGSPIDGPLTTTDLARALQTQGPVGCQIDIPDIGDHAVIICDAKTDPTGNYYVKVADPGDGSVSVMPFAQFRNNYRGTGGRWIRTYITYQNPVG